MTDNERRELKEELRRLMEEWNRLGEVTVETHRHYARVLSGLDRIFNRLNALDEKSPKESP